MEDPTNGNANPFSLKQHDFQIPPSEYDRRRMKELEDEEGSLVIHLEPRYAGVAAFVCGDQVELGLSVNDASCSIDFIVCHVGRHNTQDKQGGSKLIADLVVKIMRDYQQEHLCKFLGIGITDYLYENISMELPQRLWFELDVVPMVFKVGITYPEPNQGSHMVDEQADSMARKCIMLFGPSLQPRLDIGFLNQVRVDAGGHAVFTTLSDYQGTVGDRTWNAVMKYAEDLIGRNIKIAFFNSTPQGGGVALMRHALVRFLRLLGIDITWYVPKPRPEIFRITKTNHNILQGVSNPDEHLSHVQNQHITDWIQQNAECYWLLNGGPMSARSKGGADVIIIDDPQMAGLIPLCKQEDRERQVLYRSHIQIRSDLVANKNSPAYGVWEYLWNDIRRADIFISHPVDAFVPKNTPANLVGFMPATTDWLDGLNKKLDDWSWRYYLNNYNVECDSRKVPVIAYPSRDYIIQVARFDPSKGIPDVVKSYGVLRRQYCKDYPIKEIPQLVICGHGAIDDPDASRIYDETMLLIDNEYSDLADDISVMRINPVDQTLNALLTKARIAVQLSTREGFEVKVSEALHKGIPVIATKAGGIPLQIKHGKNGYIVEAGDIYAVAKHLNDLLYNTKLYEQISGYAARSISDEVGTVGNALCWLYLATVMSKEEKILPNKRWINDMARDYAEEPYTAKENRLPRRIQN